MAATPGKGSKRKGNSGEREIVRIFEDLGYDARRTPLSGGGHIKGDVVGPPVLHIEVKRQERTNFYEWFRQAEKDRPPGKMPIVLHRKNNGQWMAFCRLDNFLQLYEAVARKAGEESQDQEHN